MENMRFKVGDRVRIKSLDWYNANKNHCGEIPLFKPSGLFVPDMSRYCNNIMTIKDICYGTCYRMKEDFWNYNWTDGMIEGLVEEENTLSKNAKLVSERLAEYVNPSEFKHSQDTIMKMLLQGAINLPDGYQFVDENGNVINATRIVLEKKKKGYPKTYKECCKIMGVKLSDCYIQGYKSPLLEDLQELLICRDAYWKLYGEENGLGKPWKPDWKDCTKPKYTIHLHCDGHIFWQDVSHTEYRWLSFPTPEMRDAFKENFKEEIEICKELL